MNNKILEKLSFGVEIEGYFHDDMRRMVRGDWHEDGSVANHFSRPNAITEFLTTSDEEECSSCEGSGNDWEDCECYENGDYDLTCTTPEEDEEGNTVHEHTRECVELNCEGDDEYHRRDCSDCDGRGHYGDGETYASEFSSEVLPNLDELITLLQKFNPNPNDDETQTHAWDYSCGLHLHIGLKDRRTAEKMKLWSVASNYKLLQRLWKQATKKGCEHLKYRLLEHDNHYYQMPSDEMRLIRDTYRGEKYRFCRFHPDTQTLEFRFLVPCEHKHENILQLLDVLTEYIGSEEHFSAVGTAEISEEVKTASREIVLPLRSVEEVKEYQILRNEYIKIWCRERGTSWQDLPEDYKVTVMHEAESHASYATNRNSRRRMAEYAAQMIENGSILSTDWTA